VLNQVALAAGLGPGGREELLHRRWSVVLIQQRRISRRPAQQFTRRRNLFHGSVEEFVKQVPALHNNALLL
jgi:hypothetical protein